MNASDPGNVSEPGSSRPVIGLTTYLEQSRTGVWDVPAAFLPQVYFDSVIQAGGIAVLLPPQPVDAAIADRVLDGLDGLVITGGKDVDPARYGQAAHVATDEPRPDRDAGEHELIHRAIARELPLLGICRGAQMLNIAQGGTLHQHLPDVIGHGGYQTGNGVFTIVDVHVEPHSKLHGLLDAVDVPLAVPVYHHQSIDRVGAGLSVTARTGDGVVQAVELTGVPFGVAVQWHPEQHEDLRIFEGLVDAAARYRTAREQPNRQERDHP